MTAIRADVSYLRNYPFQVTAGLEARWLDAASPNVIYPLDTGEDTFVGWGTHAWWYRGRWTPGSPAQPLLHSDQGDDRNAAARGRLSDGACLESWATSGTHAGLPRRHSRAAPTPTTTSAAACVPRARGASA